MEALSSSDMMAPLRLHGVTARRWQSMFRVIIIFRKWRMNINRTCHANYSFNISLFTFCPVKVAYIKVNLNINFNNIPKNPYTGVHPMDIGISN